jgi:hypothetical protein
LPRRLSTIDGQAIPEAWIIDLSAGGIGLLVDAPQAVGSQLRVELEACPQAAPVRAVATVMHCQPTDGEYRLGCRFTTPLTESDLQVLLQ